MIGKFLEKKRSGYIVVDLEEPRVMSQFWISMGLVRAFSIYKPTT